MQLNQHATSSATLPSGRTSARMMSSLLSREASAQGFLDQRSPARFKRLIPGKANGAAEQEEPRQPEQTAGFAYPIQEQPRRLPCELDEIVSRLS
eukprot:m.721730 g.721730  ORF g.721730 m.721730 type:complete len:95 (-) comp58820_c2_seq12:49-333(-)